MIECLARATPAIWRVAYAELKRKPTQSKGAKLPIPPDLAVDYAMKAKRDWTGCARLGTAAIRRSG